MPASEAQIRDALCSRLDLIEPGLTLLNKEQYIPNELGTRGFVDLFASDAAGRYVIIELKRSGPASREAIHELLKYVEGVKAHFAAREDEVRTIVISTEWDELLVPFCSFYPAMSSMQPATPLLSIPKATRLLLNRSISLIYQEDGCSRRGTI